jgi:hypothetical protein
VPVLSAQQIADFAKAAGFIGNNLAIAVAVAKAESSGDTSARNPKSGTDRLGDYYRGLWQISTVHKQYSDAVCYDGLGNANAAYAISGGGTNWKPWEAFTNGAYKKYLAEATAAAGSATATGGSAGSLTNVVGDIAYPVPPPTRLDPAPMPPKDPGTLIVLGRSLEEQIGNCWTGGSVDMTADEIPSLSLTFIDQEFAIWGAAWNTQGTAVDWDNWRLELAGKSASEQGEINYTTLEFWPRGVASLKQRQGSSRVNVSPGQWIEAEAGIAGLSVVNFEARGIARTIGPDVSSSSDISGVGEPTTTIAQEPENAWATMQRLAKEDGCILFVVPGGSIVYGKPSILVRAMPYFDAGFRGSLGDPALDFTKIKTDILVETTNVRSNKRATLWLPRSRGERVRPGMTCRFPGFPSFDDGTYLVKHVSWSFDDLNEDVQIEVEVAVDPVPQGEKPDSSFGDPSVATLSGIDTTDLKKGTKTASDFVAWAQKQAGDQYNMGATPNASDPDPKVFDCSSLVQWAAAQVGIGMPRTSDAQLAACNPISISDAAMIKGALIFIRGSGANGHVVISLGDGRSTIEARGQKYGVVNYKIDGRGFNAAGTIRGMYYGPVRDEETRDFNGPVGPDHLIAESGRPSSVSTVDLRVATGAW